MKRYTVLFVISYKKHYAFAEECRRRPTGRWIKRVALKRTDLPKNVTLQRCQDKATGHFYVNGYPVGYFNTPEVVYNG